MQGLPTNLLTQAQATKVGKTDSSLTGAETKTNKVIGESSNKNAFASLLSGLFGSEENASTENASTNGTDLTQLLSGNKSEKENGDSGIAAKVAATNSASALAENKIDLLLKTKEAGQKASGEVVSLTAQQAMPKEVLANVQKLLETKTPDSEGMIEQKISSASDNLNALLKALKGEENIQEVSEESSLDLEKNKSPLDFLLKQSKNSSNAETPTKVVDGKVTNANPDAVSKLGLSSEDFLSQLKEVKDGNVANKENKIPNSVKGELTSAEFDPKALLSKQMNQSMKSYGQKQEMLGDGIIKNTKDLASKDAKIKGANASIDELKNPDLKVSNELSHIKESFIPQMQKSESGQSNETNTNVKVLDLSKINTSNTNEIIKRISDYVEQSQVANKDSLDLTVKHDSLGQFKIQVNRPAGGGNLPMDMQITTSTAEGHDFFVKNEIGLMKNLSQAGIQLSDLRIVSSGEGMSFAQNDSKNSNNSQFGNQMQKEFMSFESGDSSRGSERRRELWQEARANQQRFGA